MPSPTSSVSYLVGLIPPRRSHSDLAGLIPTSQVSFRPRRSLEISGKLIL
ncbi:hypothetical protein Syun_026183 [Stephania yunnanensis]|uniref:Uncharacterized protein n=1 Tax=Stephania yunnanensis TaxID=152371 RepID=A0AAP0EYJ0_9MAGN